MCKNGEDPRVFTGRDVGGAGSIAGAGQATASVGLARSKQLSLLGQAMSEEVRAATRNYLALLERVRMRGYCEAGAMDHAKQRIEEAEMWALRSVSEI